MLLMLTIVAGARNDNTALGGADFDQSPTENKSVRTTHTLTALDEKCCSFSENYRNLAASGCFPKTAGV
jgi:hypothetical protein